MPRSKFSIGLRFALQGIYAFFMKERNAKIHLLAAILAVITGIYFDLTLTEWLWIALAITLVFITEMFNTSIELLCDLFMPYHHPQAGKLKDVAAGAVLIAVVFAVIVAAVVFGGRIF